MSEVSLQVLREGPKSSTPGMNHPSTESNRDADPESGGGSNEGTPHGTLGSLTDTSAPNKDGGIEFVYLSASLQLFFQALLSH